MSLRTLAAAAVICAAAGLAVTPGAQAAPVQLTGTQLASALLPASAFFPGGGAKLVKTWLENSGTRIEHAGARYHLTTISCANLLDTFGYPGFGESAAASNGYTTSAGSTAFFQGVYQFTSPAGAGSFLTGSKSAWTRCSSFKDSGTITAKVTLTPGGSGSYTMTSVVHIGKTVDRNALLITAAGNDVGIVEANGTNTPPPSSPSLRTLMPKLLDRVEADR
jgi:PknH-like protein